MPMRSAGEGRTVPAATFSNRLRGFSAATKRRRRSAYSSLFVLHDTFLLAGNINCTVNAAAASLSLLYVRGDRGT